MSLMTISTLHASVFQVETPIKLICYYELLYILIHSATSVKKFRIEIKPHTNRYILLCYQQELYIFKPRRCGCVLFKQGFTVLFVQTFNNVYLHNYYYICLLCCR